MQGEQDNKSGQSPINRFQKEIQSSLSPKFTEMKTGVRTSRFGRPQKQTEHDINSVPTEISKFVSKHSPKRLKPKEKTQDSEVQTGESRPGEIIQKSPSENKENSSNFAENKNLQTNIEQRPVKIPSKIMEANAENSPTDLLHVEDESAIQQKISADYNFEQTSFADISVDPVVDDEISEVEKEKQDLSDTDSALGSAESCNDEFIAGQIVWGSFSRSSWYPCIVYPDLDGNVISNSNKGKMVHVKYFNLGGSASLNIKNVFEFKTIEDFWEHIKDYGIKKSRIKPFTSSCYKSIEEARMFLKYPIDERTAAYDKVSEYQAKEKRSKHAERNVQRKSIDSLLDSPTTSLNSPHSSNHEPTKDPIESYLEIISSIDFSDAKKTVKREKKLPSVQKEEFKVEEVLESNSDRRRSVRAIKKRKYDDFEEDVKSESSENKPIESPSMKPKVKRQKMLKEETLEERFLIESKYLRNIFYAVNKKKVCSACKVSNKEPTFRCTGNGNIKCAGWFHKDCTGHSETKAEEIRHQTGDSDEIIKTSAIKTYVTCKPCLASVKNCSVCENPVEFISNNFLGESCPNTECYLAFHSTCLNNFPQGKNGNKRYNQCPQHTCHTCYAKDIHSSGSLVKCMKCPSAYHSQFGCVPAGSTILSQTQIICPRHPTHKESTRTSKDKSVKQLNLDWCAVCDQSGDLVCCDSCPHSFHYGCVNYTESEDKYICEECQDGRLPLYNTIVWARVGSYRWWPGLIMPNTVLPESVLKTQKDDREFCVRFFGSYDYFWTTCERVFNYDGGNLTAKTGSSRLDSAFNTALDEAYQLFQIINKENSLTVLAKPKPYTKILSNRPIPPVKMKKVDEVTQEKCNCKITDPNPCGRDSNCINLMLNFECNKMTCPAGEKCQNQKLSKREYADMKIVPTGNRGFGAVCEKDIPEETLIIEYVGDLINTTEFNKRMKAKIDKKEKEFYFLTVEGDLYVDAEPAGNLARFINHSCEPNCTTRKITVDGNTRIAIVSNQFIKAGTELTFDYQMEFVDNKKTACFCGSAKCSGLIGEKPKEPVKTAIKKKKRKRRAPVAKIVPPNPKKQRNLDSFLETSYSEESTKDPIEEMLKKMPYQQKRITRKMLAESIINVQEQKDILTHSSSEDKMNLDQEDETKSEHTSCNKDITLPSIEFDSQEEANNNNIPEPKDISAEK